METNSETVDGVMIGREAYQNPWILADADARIFGSAGEATQPAGGGQMLPFIADNMPPAYRCTASPPHAGTVPGATGARAWRRHLSEHAHLPGAGAEVVTAHWHILQRPFAPGKSANFVGLINQRPSTGVRIHAIRNDSRQVLAFSALVLAGFSNADQLPFRRISNDCT